MFDARIIRRSCNRSSGTGEISRSAKRILRLREPVSETCSTARFSLVLASPTSESSAVTDYNTRADGVLVGTGVVVGSGVEVVEEDARRCQNA